MNRTQLDYASIREQARFETVLTNYGLEMRGHGAERMIFCPFHDDGSPSCSVNVEKKIFHCFACGEKGTILDFVARMEPCTITEAARLLSGWCNVSDPFTAPAGTAKVGCESLSPNEPLGFELPLDPYHPYLKKRGISLATITRFGLGYCDRGIMKGRICIPVHDECGRLVAYAGRWPGSNPPAGQPRYRFPRGFRKRLLLFNFHRVAEATHLVIVEGFWSVFWLDALGIAAVALMGCTLSEEQENTIRRSSADRVNLLLDGDEAGRAATSEILSRLARHLLVHAPDLPEGAQPDTMDRETIVAMIRTGSRN
jgi:DNA primase